MSLRMHALLIAATVMVALPCAMAAPFTNGSLTPANPAAVSTPGYLLSDSGLDTTTLLGWTINSVDLVASTYWQAPPSAIYSVDLNGLASGMMYQTFDTTAGHQYTVSFYYAGNPDMPTNLSPLRQAATYVVDGSATSSTYVTSTGTQVPIPTPPPANLDISVVGTTKANMHWASQSYTFIALSASSTLFFRGNLSQSQGIVIGNVSVTDNGQATVVNNNTAPVPEPVSAILIGAGLLGIAVRRKIAR